jgi:hypothetical protein
VAYNTGSAAFSIVVLSQVELGCTVIFGHDQANFPGAYTDLGGNLEQSPGVCDRVSYWLQADSVCLPDFHPAGTGCGVIGARAVGCGF